VQLFFCKPLELACYSQKEWSLWLSEITDRLRAALVSFSSQGTGIHHPHFH
jgi:hypothetical protein